MREEGRQRGNRSIIRDSSIKSIILVFGYLIVIRDSSIPKIHNSGACLPDSDSSIYLRSIILVPGYLDTWIPWLPDSVWGERFPGYPRGRQDKSRPLSGGLALPNTKCMHL